jgi:hypothetical protein
MDPGAGDFSGSLTWMALMAKACRYAMDDMKIGRSEGK